jgi:hypothetical protein
MLPDELVRVLRAKARARARRRSDAALVDAADKADRVANQSRSDEARAVFSVLADAYRTELTRRRATRKAETA